MRFTILSVLSATLLAAAAPHPLAFQGLTIPLHRRGSTNLLSLADVKAEKEALATKYARTLTAYKRNTGQDHPLAATFFANDHGKRSKRGTGTDDLVEETKGLRWSGALAVGTPPQSFVVDFDTGSADLFLPGQNCASFTCDGHAKYDPKNSTTAEELDQRFETAYGDGSLVAGKVWSDTIGIAGLAAQNQAFVVADIYSPALGVTRYKSDGLLGMSFPALSDHANLGVPLIQTLISQGQLDNSLFAFSLSSDAPSELNIGAVNPELYTGNFTWSAVTHEAFWDVTADTVVVDGMRAGGPMFTIVDTSTPLIVGSPAYAAAIYSHIPGAIRFEDFWRVPCDTTKTIAFVYQGRSFDIPVEAFAIPLVDLGVGNTNGCIGAFVSDLRYARGFIVGDSFLRGVYTVFDVENGRVGFADRA